MCVHVVARVAEVWEKPCGRHPNGTLMSNNNNNVARTLMPMSL